MDFIVRAAWGLELAMGLVTFACADLIAAYNFDDNHKVSQNQPPATAQPLSQCVRR